MKGANVRFVFREARGEVLSHSKRSGSARDLVSWAQQ